ncbi:pyridoxamine 5'-phosphate oxidase family protein [Amphibacillus xylanus]|uniref:General stress protein FMN-binding split barrel domain-containing protein n=1 Tax=Amphibacillus xylanus (strain ATCC 51415 / DSM 6626 / JCM 7361 / LMG 17667 / NBRC 15112 / Ep01) TaxID=698758 RepID=K0J795_AMPXN|nr:pyridoxamine 5'-phosphate oxidase family protein [Amphibacillus xylanus]BAM47193.1 hypothetical protein AXY_10610 [Amphibacillus xylanus NBRC 15112]
MDNQFKQEDIETFRQLIKGIDIAMVTTQSEEGLVSRPMKTQEVEFDGDLWFFTKKQTDKYDEIKHDSHVNVAYVGKSYVSVRGKAEIVDDLEKKKEYWTKAHEKIMQTNYDDPNVILIKIKAEAAEYWETGNFIKNIAFMYKRLTGQKAETVDINETIELKK